MIFNNICPLKLLFGCFMISLLSFAKADYHKLKSISVVFRHGDCAPDENSLYPKDPHYKHSYFPIEYGQLTNLGKRQEYELGEFLRNRYNGSLGNLYLPSNILARSTDYDRTKASLLLVLASLYPPKGQQRWKSNFNWQPIPITYVPVNNDSLLFSVLCPSYKKESERVKNSIEYKRDLSLHKKLMDQLSINTGLNITTSSQISNLYNTLTAEKSFNLTLPQWTGKYFPNGPMKDGVLFDYKTYNYNTKLQRLNGGMILRKVINDANNTKQGKKMPIISLYSAHGLTVASVLWALNTWKDHIPQYSSAIIFELYEKDKEYFVQVVYYKGVPAETTTLKINGCSEFCPIDDFKNLLHDVLPTDIDKECHE